MFNFKEIQIKYPKAFDLLINNIKSQLIESIEVNDFNYIVDYSYIYYNSIDNNLKSYKGLFIKYYLFEFFIKHNIDSEIKSLNDIDKVLYDCFEKLNDKLK